MKLNLFFKLLIGTSIWFTTSVFADEAWQVTGKAWDALAKNDFNTVERLANESVRKWGEQARKRNDEFSDYLQPRKPKNIIHSMNLPPLYGLRARLF